jgi:hypothetical protein
MCFMQVYPVSEGYLRKIPVERRGKYPERRGTFDFMRQMYTYNKKKITQKYQAHYNHSNKQQQNITTMNLNLQSLSHNVVLSIPRMNLLLLINGLVILVYHIQLKHACMAFSILSNQVFFCAD